MPKFSRALLPLQGKLLDNREDDPEYIVRLVGQVIRVSVETVEIVNGLPSEFEPT